MAPPLEVELYAPVRDFLVAQGFIVRGEVQGCDVVGVRDGAVGSRTAGDGRTPTELARAQAAPGPQAARGGDRADETHGDGGPAGEPGASGDPGAGDGAEFGVPDADQVVVVELKRNLSVDLLAQAVRRQRLTDTVYVAIPRPVSAAGERHLRDLLPLLRRLEIGLLAVDTAAASVEIRLQPVAAQRRREPRRRRALLAEVAARSADETPGGTHRRRLMTAYRENALLIAVALEGLGPDAAATPAELRELGTGPRTLAILRGNAYGWFERVDRGLYRLTAAGAAGLAEFGVTAARKRAQLASLPRAAT